MRKANCLLSRFLFFVVFTACFFVFSQKNIFAADIVINEVFANPVDENTEFIELFNKGSESVSLSNWKISDKVKTFSIPTITIEPNTFYVLDKSATGISLNNSGGEDVTLKDQTDQIIDSFTYDVTVEERSWSRHPDGIGTFFNDITPTKGSENSDPVPTPTFTPTVTPTPTRTPTPINTPTPTKTPTPTPTSKIVSTSSPTLEPSETHTVGKPSPTKVLGVSTKSALLVLPTATPTEKPKPTIKVQGIQSQQNYLPFFFIGGGVLLLISCGILTFQPQLKKLWETIYTK